eukprot:TRINITY_DN16198_c0_g1_i4.p1 TRINITY_DN16198_c0_g1~~TRINITY_DN16198_c0_g1_i4.p1  ORF type:complete len:211 (-),score=34.35 TRINITY_DN16198_c0_g1_i4:24-656(-)
MANRIALVHSLAHIESYAIDLSWDILLRTAFVYPQFDDLPADFWLDWAVVAEDEARHFTSLAKRLGELGSEYGAVPVHEGLWESAQETSHDLLARLVIVHMVHEARGLDVTPKTIEKMKSLGDAESAKLLTVIHHEEIDHVRKGCKWFHYLCAKHGKEPAPTFHGLVGAHFRGALKPPFNTEARKAANMPEEYYLPMVENNHALRETGTV